MATAASRAPSQATPDARFGLGQVTSDVSTPVPDSAAEGSSERTAEEIDSLVRDIISEVLGNKPYAAETCDLWCDQILERSLRRISALGRPFKYIATCVISRQHGGSVLDTAATAFWDTQSDSLCCTRLGNGMVDCIVTVYACRRS
eukprot:TRINITY_DN57050_c0_g1_i1.p1 TRINITY_DN57050_c0_g1~~TRINITY_DN57050_c0_g1_i1.p1  ORF type:complete len:146 (+),score=16.53 TRINITY_DN57050_c0_g1_i1:105-542(+)